MPKYSSFLKAESRRHPLLRQMYSPNQKLLRMPTRPEKQRKTHFPMRQTFHTLLLKQP